MTEEGTIVMRGNKCARIIQSISNLYEVSLGAATDIYYNSETADLIEQGIADLHCRSDKYLAQCIWEEYCESKDSNNAYHNSMQLI